MAQDFGNGVSRTLSAVGRQFLQTVWQASKPPLDSELNLVGQVDAELVRDAVRAAMPSGFLNDPMRTEADFEVNPAWCNWFKFGWGENTLWANVNGWVLPVTGSGVADGDLKNRINLYPPPATDSRIDFVFLEVWQAQVAPNPSTLNKPTASTLFKYGNTLFGGANLPDDLEDPTIGYETTERVQLQYRIRVVGQGAGLGDSVNLPQYPEGLDDPNVRAQGAELSPVAGYPFTNMGNTLGDQGLWRAGAGDDDSRADLGTVDGYSYAIPICAIFRRNSGLFVALTNSGNANQNGSFSRNPVAGSITNPLQATRTLTPVTLTDGISADATGLVSVTGLSGSGLDNSNISWGSTVLKIGDEIVTLTSTGSGVVTIGTRGRFGTQPVPHAAGEELSFYTFRPDGKFADEISATDILDMRHAVNFGQWSYDALAKHNLKKILEGTLRTSFKQGSGTDTQGIQFIEVDTLLGRLAGTLPNQTEQVDGFDGIRTVFSDASLVQNDISLLLTPDGSGVSVSSNAWEVAPDFNVTGFLPNGSSQWQNGAIIRLYMGGASGSGGARGTSQTGARFMRFVSPQEYWLSRDALQTGGPDNLGNQTPFLMRFVGDSSTAPQAWSLPAGLGDDAVDHPGPMFPLPDQGFLMPYAVLGGVVNTNLAYATAITVTATSEVRLTGSGVNFDTAGQWAASATDPQTLDTSGIANLLLQGQRNLFDMLTAGGQDLSGNSSELFLVLQDAVNPTNQGLFRVVGAGTIGYTSQNASTVDGLVLSPIGQATLAVNAATVSVEVRSLYMNTEDGPSSALASACIVLTDLAATQGTTANPWNGLSSATLDGDMVLDTSILYGPGRAGMLRLPDALQRFAVENPVGVSLLREAPENKDPDPLDIATRIGAPEDEYYFNPQPFQAWNRLPSLGQHAPIAPGYGDGRYNFETRREAELFVDLGSKTVVFRPYQQLLMSLPLRETSQGQIPAFYDDGVTPVDGANLFASAWVFDVPAEYMPRFSRQDIPVRENVVSGGPYFGVNHLFSDTNVVGDNTLNIVGGTSTGASLKIVTGTSSGLDYGQYSSGDAWYQGRLYADVNARSSDLNHVLRGIQLPPYLGVARVYGVYDKRDYDTNGSAWLDRGFTPDTGVAKGTNLLRTSADKQTLFIVKDGASDVIENANAHTYVIPEDVIDITLSPEYVSGESFDDLEYVVEVSVFGFAQGFINENNYVLSRTDSLSESLVSNVRMMVPAAMPVGVRGYVAYQRTPYQGDPFLTRDSTTLQAADYEARYGQVPVASAYALTNPVQQYSLDNEQIPEIPNPRALEILASVDFWTTVGTGKVSGPVYSGTPSDVGALAPTTSRIPSTSTSNIDQPQPRAFTEPQPVNGFYAGLSIVILNNDVLEGVEVTFQHLDQTYTYTAVVGPLGTAEFQIGSDAAQTASNLAMEINTNLPLVYTMQFRAIAKGNTVQIQSLVPGVEGQRTYVSISDPTALMLDVPGRLGVMRNRSALLGGTDVPVNAARNSTASTPAAVTGMVGRLPLGILVNDSDFLSEDPLRKGVLYQYLTGGMVATSPPSTFNGNAVPYGQGNILGMAEGAALQYTAYNAVSAPDGTRKFRVYRGAVVYTGEGAPVEFSVGGFESGAVLKGAVLVGRAYLVRNGEETAFESVRSYGGELQLVIVTRTLYGEGVCEGLALEGVVSPTDYGKGYAAADRYRLEGRPLMKGPHLPAVDVELVPYPPEDPANDDPCA